MILIGRPINGISLNGREYVLDSDDNPKAFKTVEDARQFLYDAGYNDETIEIEGIDFVDENENVL